MTTSGSSDSDHDNFRCALGFEGTGIQIMVFVWFLYGFCFEGLIYFAWFLDGFSNFLRFSQLLMLEKNLSFPKLIKQRTSLSWLWIVAPLVFRQLLKFRSEKPVLQGNSSSSCCRAARCCHFKNGMAREGCLVDLYIPLHISMSKDDIHLEF